MRRQTGHTRSALERYRRVAATVKELTLGKCSPLDEVIPKMAAQSRQAVTILDVAVERLSDLRLPPGNRLEALTGDRAGQHSIRINDQLRICFCWTPTGPEDVEIVDYH